MKITLLHPSRGRAEQAKKTLDLWINLARCPDNIEHIISLDNDDPQLDAYRLNFKNSKIIVNQNNNVVQATNHGIKHVNGDFVIYLSDDFHCPDDWDHHVLCKWEQHGKPNLWLLKVDDLLQKFSIDVLTIPIMTRALMERLGYFWHPGYASMFVDQDLYHTCANNKWLHFAEELKFEHMHYCNAKAVNDETYARSAKNWNTGMAYYKARKQQGFPL
jgi:glycosyltransferase involved in cell wall biosynthesis